jgi:hypothetical protein
MPKRVALLRWKLSDVAIKTLQIDGQLERAGPDPPLTNAKAAR